MKNIYQSEKMIFTHECGCERYTYSLLTFAADSGDRFGVRIRLCHSEEEHESGTQDLFSSREGALRFLGYLWHSLTTPANLADVTEDLLCDFDQNR